MVSSLDSFRGSEQQIPAQLAAILAVVDDAVVAVDSHDRITYINRAAEERYRANLVDVQGQPLERLYRRKSIHPEEEERSRRILDEYGVWRGESVHVTNDGTEIPVEKTVAVLRDNHGRRIGRVATIHDIRHHKDAERQMRDALRAKDRFIAALSHELRTPLNPILISVSHMLDDGGLPLHIRDDLAMIRRNIELETRLIDDLLDIMRLTRGKLVLQKAKVDLAEIVRQATDGCVPEARAKGLQMLVQANNALVVSGDAARLHQVVWSIVRNAIKFTHRGEVRVRCFEENDNAVVTVEDEGVGLDPEAIDHLFTAFDNCDGGGSRMFGGLGLGLAISKALIEMHGGAITAESPGRGLGAAFTVSVPLCDEFSSPCRHADTEVGTSSSKLLVVEDHEDSARTIARLLRSYGHQVKVAHDVSTALRMARAEHFDLLVSDIGLPDGTGLDLMRQLAGRGMRGVALSGHGTEQDHKMSLEAGFAAHLVKPIRPQELQQTIADLLTITCSG